MKRRTIRMAAVALAAPLTVTAIGHRPSAIGHEASALAAPTASQTRPAAAAPVTAAKSKTIWHAKIGAGYLNKHHKIWWSKSFKAKKVYGRFRCWNGGDGGKAMLQIIGSKGAAVTAACDWKWHKTVVLRNSKRAAVRFRLQALGHAHTTEVQARR